ncbi:MAG: LytTR family transcriptional regulator DNA-binding domain-containing protein [Defluviitaleaceae bacterium]|nr:LytTR family transcriptional regulator DNA-binding domain-containing protein [Defluviitaleaceae bacterium]
MKININIHNHFTETEITINAAAMSDELEKVIASLRALDFKLTGTSKGQTHILDAAQILYIDTVDKKTFLYTKSDVYETALRLYELEQQLNANDFFRASKSSIINFSKIKSLKSDIDGRIIVVMENNEKLIVSRQYTTFIKNKLGRS